MTDDDVICVAAYFAPRQGTEWIDDAFNLSDSFAECLQIRLTHVDAEQRSLAYCPKNIERVRQELTQGRGTIVSCDATRPGNYPGKHLQAPFSSVVQNAGLFSQRDRVGVAYVHAIVTHLKEVGVSVVEFGTRFMRFMAERFDGRYCVIHRMSQRYVPVTYFGGGPTSEYVSGADKIAQKKWYWRGGGVRFKELVLGAYWGNLLSPTHWQSDPDRGKSLRAELFELCRGNLEELADGRLMFWAPYNPLTEVADTETFRRTLEAAYDRHGIRMIAKMDEYVI